MSSGNLNVGVAAKGINFGANTGAAGEDATLLNWYEEGTFTTGITFGGAAVGVTTSIEVGFYTRVGNLVSVQGQLVLTSKGSSTGAAVLTGLPWAAVTSGYSAASFGRLANLSFADMIIGNVESGGQTIELDEIANGGTSTTLTDANFANNTNIVYQLTYRV